MLRLRVVKGTAAPSRVRVADGLTLGRAAEADVVLPDPMVSRVHARIAVHDDVPSVVDLASANGTHVNGARVERSLLGTGDRLRVGDVEFVIEEDDGSTTDPVEVARSSRRFGRTTRRIVVSEDAAPVAGETASDSVSDADEDGDEPRATAVPRLVRFARGAALASDADSACVFVRVLPGGPFLLAGRFPDSPEDAKAPPRHVLSRIVRDRRPLLLGGDSTGDMNSTDAVRGTIACAPVLTQGGSFAGEGAAPAAAVLVLERREARRAFSSGDLASIASLAEKTGPSLESELNWFRWRATEDPDLAGSAATSLVGESAKFLETLDVAQHVAAMHGPVLLRGEPGSGRRLLARFLHERSRGRNRRFVVVACAELPPGHEVAALFGEMEEGRRRPGLVEDVGFGTLCLADVAALALPAQAALAEAALGTRYEPLGAGQPRIFRCRIVATTTRSLDQLAAEGAFHGPLAAALSAVTVGVPSLAEREGDATILAEHFAAVHGRRHRGRPSTLTDAARRDVASRSYPGNVAELSVLIERAVLRAQGDTLDAADLGDLAATEAADLSLAAAERAAIVRALHSARGRRGRAAELLGISWPTLTRKIRAYGIDG